MLGPEFNSGEERSTVKYWGSIRLPHILCRARLNLTTPCLSGPITTIPGLAVARHASLFTPKAEVSNLVGLDPALGLKLSCRDVDGHF